jgi:glycosyltransferase involved in cell wall biosynthesis
MKTVLIITHDFAPIGGNAVIRPLKFVRYLPQFGWRPIVLTVDHHRSGMPWLDNSLLAEIPEGAIIQRVVAPRSPYGYRWFPRGFALARSIFQREPIDLIFTSSPPHNTHVLGWWLSKYFRRRFVAEFRDGWTRSENFSARSRARQLFDRWVESRIVRTANRLIAVTEPLADDLALNSLSARSKTTVLYNGYDPADFKADASQTDDRNVFNLVHAGSITSSPEKFIRAVQALSVKDRLFAAACRIEFIGDLAQPYINLIHDLGLTAIIRAVDRLPHASLIQRLCAADGLLLFIHYPQQPARQRGMLTAKFGEYIGAQKPILAFAGNSAAADFMRRYDLGVLVPPDDVAAIERALSDVFERWCNQTLSRPNEPEVLDLFDWQRSTQKLAALFDELTAAE